MSKSTPLSSTAPLEEPLIMAHRGLSSVAPENTLAAFAAAAEAGVEWVELDVALTEEGLIPVIHDATTDRTTNRSGSVYSLTSRDLEVVDAGSWFSPQFAGQTIPTLDEVVAQANKLDLNLNVELKSIDEGLRPSVALVETTLAALTKFRSDLDLMISSFSPLLLAEVAKYDNAPLTAWVTMEETMAEGWFSVMEITGATYIHPDERALTKHLVSEIRSSGYGVNPWTVNSLARANELLNWGCTGVISDVAGDVLAGPGASKRIR